MELERLIPHATLICATGSTPSRASTIFTLCKYTIYAIVGVKKRIGATSHSMESRLRMRRGFSIALLSRGYVRNIKDLIDEE